MTLLFKRSIFLSLLLAAFHFAACSSSSDSTATGDDDDDTTSGISELEDVPNATDPVVAGASSNLTTTGPSAAVSFGEDTTVDDFSDGGSYGSCEMVNRMRGAIGQAGQGAMIMCFMQQMFADNTDIYDGEYHAFDLDFADAESDTGAPDHIKIKVERDGDAITSFEMFACQSGTQNFYFNGTIDGTTLTIINKGSSATGEGTSVEFASTITGEVDDAGDFIGEKVIDLAYVNDFGDDSGNYCDTTTTATDTTIAFSGYCMNTGSDSGAEALFAMADLDDNDSALIDEWGLGAGAAKIVSDFNTDGLEVEQGWDDTGVIDEESAYLSDEDFVAGSVPATSDTAPDVSFGSGQTYDCSDTVDETLTGTIETLMTACSDYDLTQEHLECQEQTEI